MMYVSKKYVPKKYVHIHIYIYIHIYIMHMHMYAETHTHRRTYSFTHFGSLESRLGPRTPSRHRSISLIRSQ